MRPKYLIINNIWKNSSSQKTVPSKNKKKRFKKRDSPTNYTRVRKLYQRDVGSGSELLIEKYSFCCSLNIVATENSKIKNFESFTNGIKPVFSQ